MFDLFFDLSEKPIAVNVEIQIKDMELYASITLESIKLNFQKVFGA